MSQKKHWRVYIPRVIGALLAALAIFYVVKAITGFMDQKPAKKEKKIQPITLLKPPPPPPPPPKVEKPPEPEVKEKIKEPEPEPDPEPIPESKPDTPPSAAEGPAGDSGPCVGPTCLPGTSGSGGGRPGSVNHWYGGLVKNEIMSVLSKHDELRRKAYYAIVKVWIKPDGVVERVELSKGSNDAEIDEVLERLLQKPLKIADIPPPNMPQPIKFKISSRI